MSPRVPDPKTTALRADGVLNPAPEKVEDELFRQHEFFDARDLVQVKYEMVRRAEHDHWTVTRAARTFGLSRPSFYEAKRALDTEGVAGLLPAPRGPKGPHKLTEEVMRYIEAVRAQDTTLRAPALASLLAQRFGVTVHPRTLERALARREKKPRPPHDGTSRYGSRPEGGHADASPPV